MKISSIALTTLLVVVFLISANGQQEEKTKISLLKSNSKLGQSCFFTVISMRHYLTTASCVVWQGAASTRLFNLSPVLAANEDRTVEETYSTFATITHVHPLYVIGQNQRYNVAILELENDLPNNFQPKPLGGIHTNSNCNFLGGTAFWQNVTVYAPQLCDARLPQAYCSRSTVAAPICAGTEAAWLSCNEGVLDGFLISDGFCPDQPSDHVLYYHSVSDFRSWIRSIIGF